jgi:hypothetical protein
LAWISSIFCSLPEGFSFSLARPSTAIRTSGYGERLQLDRYVGTNAFSSRRALFEDASTAITYSTHICRMDRKHGDVRSYVEKRFASANRLHQLVPNILRVKRFLGYRFTGDDERMPVHGPKRFGYSGD